MAVSHLKIRVTIWFILAISILLAIGGTIYNSFSELDSQRDAVTHTYEVINHIDGVVSNIKDVQASQRGYIITGQVDYLAPYLVAVPKIGENLDLLESLVSDNPAQVKRTQTLRAETDARLKIAAEIIETYQNKGQDAAFKIVRTGAGKKEMDQIRALAAEMVAEEKTLLTLRQDHVYNAAKVTRRLGALGLTLSIGVLAVVFWLISLESAKRANAEKTVKHAFSDMKVLADQDQLISRMSDYLQGCRTMEEAKGILENSMPRLLPGTKGSISLVGSSPNTLETIVTWGEGESEHDFASEQCWSMRKGQLHRYEVGGSTPLCQHLLQDEVGASQCLPMQAHGETIGVFVLSTPEAESMNDIRQNAVRRISEQTSFALSNLRLQNTLRDQSIRDLLTGLFNRRYLEATLERELARAHRNTQPLSVLLLDIDHFKKYNDTRGHDAGDALLAKFAQLLQTQIRKEDIACRYGGEEFVIVMPMATLEKATERAKGICEATRNMMVKSCNESFGGVTVSIGVSAIPMHGKTGEELITAADKALYHAKNSGRDQVQAAVVPLARGD